MAEGFDGGNAGYRDPLAAYSHSTGTPTGCAITGGAFLTGGNYPSQYNNAYFYADICSQWIYYLPAPGYSTQIPFVTSLGRGAVDLQISNGELYYLSRDNGGVSRVKYTPPSPGLRFVPVTPCRLLDTRESLGAFGTSALAGGGVRDFSNSSADILRDPCQRTGLCFECNCRAARPAWLSNDMGGGRTAAACIDVEFSRWAG